MILERVEKDDLVKAIYESSNIVASTYNKNNKNLNITFKNGGSYTYQDVSPTDYLRFETADSQGKILNGNIKKYAYLKHDNVDTNEVINKIKELKANEVNNFEDGLVNVMKELIDNYDTTGTLSTPLVGRLNSMFNVYNEMTKTTETA
jgi:hypothetical protein